MDLTAKQKRFVDEYLIDLNATQAAIRAGYSQKTAREIGCQNLTKLNVKIAIEERLKAIESAKIADAKEVLEHLTAVLRNQLTEEVVVVESEGGNCGSTARTIEKEISIRDRIKAAELLGKRYKLFEDNDADEDKELTINIVYGAPVAPESGADG